MCAIAAAQQTPRVERPTLDPSTAAREAALIEKAERDPGPLGYAELASYYRELVPEAPRERRAQIIAQALDAADKALSRDPHLTAALTVKAELRGIEADLQTDPVRRIALLKEADALQGIPPMPPDYEAVFLRLLPRRVTGDVPQPTKIRDVRPAYPPIAQSARVQGTIAIETILDAAGRVAAARVIHSIPLLDAAALAAVRQWVFTPVTIDGTPTPSLTTVTVGFVLQ